MRHESEAPGVLMARAGADETFCSAGKLSGSEGNVNPYQGIHARAWLVTVRLRARVKPRGWEYFVSITNGVTFVAFWGHPTTENRLYAKLEAEFRGATVALDWLKHLRPDTPAEIRFSTAGFSVFMGESPCPEMLKAALDSVRRAYITSGDAIRIDRERRALMRREESIAA